jgi:hypothetical protein
MVVMPVGMKVRGGGLILVKQVFNVSMFGELGMGFVVVFLKLRTLHPIQLSQGHPGSLNPFQCAVLSVF